MGARVAREGSSWSNVRAAGSYLLLGSWNFLSSARCFGFLNSSICSGDGPGACCVESGSRSRYAAGVSTGAAAAASAEYHLRGQSGLGCRDICETRSCRSGRTVSLQLAILFGVSRCSIGRRSYVGSSVPWSKLQNFWNSSRPPARATFRNAANDTFMARGQSRHDFWIAFQDLFQYFEYFRSQSARGHSHVESGRTSMPNLNSSLCLARKTHRHAVAAIMYRPNETLRHSRIFSSSDAEVDYIFHTPNSATCAR